MRQPAYLFITAVTLGLGSLTHAVCTNNTIAIGASTKLASGDAQWNIYDTSCNLLNTYQQPSAISICDSQVFYCQFGTTNIAQYDDPVSGWAYACAPNTTAETCGADSIISCGYAFWGEINDANPLES